VSASSLLTSLEVGMFDTVGRRGRGYPGAKHGSAGAAGPKHDARACARGARGGAPDSAGDSSRVTTTVPANGARLGDSRFHAGRTCRRDRIRRKPRACEPCRVTGPCKHLGAEDSSAEAGAGLTTPGLPVMTRYDLGSHTGQGPGVTGFPARTERAAGRSGEIKPLLPLYKSHRI
jgi:hypothetical protein